jgi:dCTP deaminase
MILTGNEINAQLGDNIIIDPFDESQLNPNSYNLRLHNELLVYEEIVLDMRRPNRFRRYVIPEDGLVLNPNQWDLGRTVERTETITTFPCSKAVRPWDDWGCSCTSPPVWRCGFSRYWTWKCSPSTGARLSGRPICPSSPP